MKTINNITSLTRHRNTKLFGLLKLGLLVFLGLQLLFWHKTEDIKPNVGVVPPAPSEKRIKLASLGDSQFFFRMNAFRLQNAGDTFGRTTPLKDYDYGELYKWLTVLDKLDNNSNMMPFLAGYYYSHSQDKDDVYYIIRYLEEHFDANPDEKWWWLYQAFYIADKMIKDQDEAERLAWRLHDDTTEKAPLWTKQMIAFVYEGQDNACASYLVINQILNDIQKGKIEAEDKNLEFMAGFLEERIPAIKEKLEAGEFNPNECHGINMNSLRKKTYKNKTLEKTSI